MVNEQIVGFEILTQIIVTQDQLCMKTSNYAWKTVWESVRETKEVTKWKKELWRGQSRLDWAQSKGKSLVPQCQAMDYFCWRAIEIESFDLTF